MRKIKTNKWTPAGVAIKAALASETYNKDQYKAGVDSSPYMCDVVFSYSRLPDLKQECRDAYRELWSGINTGGCWNLQLHLCRTRELDVQQYAGGYGGDVYRIKLGRIYWRAVAKYILSGARTIKNIDKVGCDAVRAAIAKGEI